MADWVGSVWPPVTVSRSPALGIGREGNREVCSVWQPAMYGYCKVHVVSMNHIFVLCQLQQTLFAIPLLAVRFESEFVERQTR
jgi:hypothetical protein